MRVSLRNRRPSVSRNQAQELPIFGRRSRQVAFVKSAPKPTVMVSFILCGALREPRRVNVTAGRDVADRGRRRRVAEVDVAGAEVVLVV